jgi:AcrR family transcriptional regulator
MPRYEDSLGLQVRKVMYGISMAWALHAPELLFSRLSRHGRLACGKHNSSTLRGMNQIRVTIAYTPMKQENKSLDSIQLKPAPMQRHNLGLRERNKLDKLQRIKAAAAALFTKKGFDATTTLEIAECARVGEGTVFLYAKDKRDLLFHICMDELEQVRDKGFAKVKPDMPLLEQLLVPETVMYRQLAKNIPLERIFFEELTFCSGKQAERLRESRLRMISRIEHLILAAEKAGAIQCNEDPAFVAQHIFFSSQSAMRWWIASHKPKVSVGIADLRRIYTLHLRALNATPAAFGKQ